MNQARRKLGCSIIIFWAIVVLAVILNAGARFATERPWLLGNSISWYVGSQAWSAILFALGNMIVAVVMSRFLWVLGEQWRMPRAYFFFLILLVVALVWLSSFPLGYFDLENQKSVISYLHEAGSRTMFLAMAVVVFFLSTNAGLSKLLRVALRCFVLYAVFCVLAVLAGLSGFYAGLLFFESFYIFAFMMLLLWCGEEATRKGLKTSER